LIGAGRKWRPSDWAGVALCGEQCLGWSSVQHTSTPAEQWPVWCAKFGPSAGWLAGGSPWGTGRTQTRPADKDNSISRPSKCALLAGANWLPGGRLGRANKDQQSKFKTRPKGDQLRTSSSVCVACSCGRLFVLGRAASSRPDGPPWSLVPQQPRATDLGPETVLRRRQLCAAPRPAGHLFRGRSNVRPQTGARAPLRSAHKCAHYPPKVRL